MSEPSLPPQTRIAILGADAEGLAVYEHLRDSGCRDITFCDPRADAEAPPGVEARTGAGWLADLDHFQLIYRGSALGGDLEVVAAVEDSGAVMTSATKDFLRACPCTVVGVTGSNGKTITTELVASVLRTQYFDNVHVGSDERAPLLTALPDIERDHVAVIELDSRQLQDLTRSPHIAVVLNLSPSHSGHADFEAFFDAESEIVRRQSATDFAVLNWSFERVRELHDATRAKTLFFNRTGEADGAFEQEGRLVVRRHGRSERLMAVTDVPIHLSVDCVLASAAVGMLFNLESEAIRDSVLSFRSVAHRMEVVRELDGIRFIDDAAATTTEATIHALHCFPERRVVLVCEGSEAELRSEQLAKEISRSRARCVFVGALGAALASQLRETAQRLKVGVATASANSIEDAVQTAHGLVAAGDVVLYSPASSVRDNAAVRERGLAFQSVVRAM